MSSESSSEGCEMRDAIAALAGQRGWNETRESWLARAGRRANVTYRSIKSLWYGEITDPEHKAARRVLDAAARHGRQEAHELAGRFESLASALRATDQDFSGAQIDALLDAARALRGPDRSRTDGGK